MVTTTKIKKSKNMIKYMTYRHFKNQNCTLEATYPLISQIMSTGKI